MFNPQQFWRRRGTLNVLLLPLSALFTVIATIRRHWLLRTRKGIQLPPVIVVGNIVAGGSGKTPVVVALATALAQRGWRPGIICRGYRHGTRASATPQQVNASSNWRDCGDEALLIHRRTKLPVSVCRKRPLAAAQLAAAGCNLIISDDGLQHYALPRRVEICVSDATYGNGNGWRLPAGPLRESPKRAQQCDIHLRVSSEENNESNDNTIIVQKTATTFYALAAPEKTIDASHFAERRITALAGIARPEDFFRTLETLGITIAQKKPLPDHAATNTLQGDTIIMTEKDAVKYPQTDNRLYALAIECKLPQSVIEQVEKLLQ